MLGSDIFSFSQRWGRLLGMSSPVLILPCTSKRDSLSCFCYLLPNSFSHRAKGLKMLFCLGKEPLSHCSFEVESEISAYGMWAFRCWLDGKTKKWFGSDLFSFPFCSVCRVMSSSEIHDKLFPRAAFVLERCGSCSPQSCSCVVANDGTVSPVQEEARLCFQTSAIYRPFHLFF